MIDGIVVGLVVFILCEVVYRWVKKKNLPKPLEKDYTEEFRDLDKEFEEKFKERGK
jgi:O-antigen/teichoic acid export membrane protein